MAEIRVRFPVAPPILIMGRQKTYQLRWYYRNREKALESMRDYAKRNAEKRSLAGKERHQKRRIKALDAYGKICQCCGESQTEFLVLDHINNDGNVQRKTVGEGSKFYLWLERNNYPTDIGLQVLCCNCNWAKHAYGICPHKRNNTPFVQ